MESTVRWVKALITLLSKWTDRTINLSALGEPLSLKNYEKEERKMINDDFQYTTDQIAEIYARLETAKLLMKLGTDMAKQVEIDIKFYRMTNGGSDATTRDD
jgi:hypothetical protein